MRSIDRQAMALVAATLVIDQATKQLEALRLLAGTAPAQGPGIKVTIADPADLLVLGTSHRRMLAQIICGRVSRYCLAHARCPVLTVPPPALAREISHGLIRWMFWHRPLTPDQVLRDRGRTAA